MLGFYTSMPYFTHLYLACRAICIFLTGFSENDENNLIMGNFLLKKWGLRKKYEFSRTSFLMCVRGHLFLLFSIFTRVQKTLFLHTPSTLSEHTLKEVWKIMKIVIYYSLKKCMLAPVPSPSQPHPTPHLYILYTCGNDDQNRCRVPVFTALMIL